MEWLKIIGPSVLMLVGGIVTWVLKTRAEELRAAEERLRQKRFEIYTDLLAPYIEILSDPTGSRSDRILRKVTSLDYKKTAFQLTIFGSDAVVRAWGDFMQHAYTREGEQQLADTKESMRLMGRVLLEIRRSLGNKGTKLTEWDMFRWYIKDFYKLQQ